MTYANVHDVATRLGRPITDPDEVAQVLAWLTDVEAMIRARIPNLDLRVAEECPAADVVTMVEASAVVRKVLNPEGKVSEDIDDYRYRLSENSSRGELFLTEEEWALLSPARGGGAFSVRPSFEPDGYGRYGVWL